MTVVGRAEGRLLYPAMGGWAATAGATLLAPAWSLALAVTAAAVAAVAARRAVVVSLVATGLAVGALSAAWHVRSLRRGIVPAMAAHHLRADVVARLVRDPMVASTTSGARFTIVAATVTDVLAGGWHHTSAPVLVLSFSPGWDGLLPGQRVELVGTLAPPRRGDSVAAVLDARAPPVAIGQAPWWQRAAGRVRAALRLACRGLPADARGLLPGLVDGDVTAEPANLTADMRTTGLTHLQAVSGENVSVLLGVMLGVARAAGLRRRSRVTLATIGLIGFVVLARPSPSVQRAAVMGGMALLAMAAGRRAAALPALSVAVLVLVVMNPFLARSVGFVLSVCATAAILLLTPSWTKRLAERVPLPVATAIAVPAAAQLACTPVLVLVFGQLTPYAIPANLVAAFAVVPATVLGVTTALVAALSPSAAAPIAWLAAAPTAVIAATAHGFAALPGAGLAWSRRVGAVVAVVAVAALLLRLRVRRRETSSSRAILSTWLH